MPSPKGSETYHERIHRNRSPFGREWTPQRQVEYDSDSNRFEGHAARMAALTAAASRGEPLFPERRKDVR